MWIKEGKPTKKPNRKPVQKAPLRMLLIFPDPWGNGRSLCPVTLLLVWMTSSDATIFPRCVAFFRKIFLKRKLRILSTFFSVNLEVCYRSGLFFAKVALCFEMKEKMMLLRYVGLSNLSNKQFCLQEKLEAMISQHAKYFKIPSQDQTQHFASFPITDAVIMGVFLLGFGFSFEFFWKPFVFHCHLRKYLVKGYQTRF